MRTIHSGCLLFAIILGSAASQATETENLGIRILPAPGKVEIDGKFADWDLGGGVFVCGDVEHQRDQLAVWIHAMYDAENLYVLARWRDETPLSNPGLAGSDHSWNGDCLQLRIIADPERQAAGKPIICWANAWRDRAGKDAIDLDFPNKNGEVLRDAIAKGAGKPARRMPMARATCRNWPCRGSCSCRTGSRPRRGSGWSSRSSPTSTSPPATGSP